MKKKLLFTAYSLGLGGIETALCNLLNHLDYSKYEVTLILEKKEGIFLDQIPTEVKVLEYKISDNKIVLFRKIYNRLKLIKWRRKLHNKYDFSCSYATYSRPGAYLALAASTNNAIWIHSNYYNVCNQDEKQMIKELTSVYAHKFKKVVFVSEDSKETTCKYFKELKDKSIVIGNIVDGESMIEKSNEKIDLKKNNDITFINVSRHEEFTKKISRIINASKTLKTEGYKFRVILVGDGENHKDYVKQVKDNNLEDTIIFTGMKKNPFPYYKIADAAVLSSDIEGYPVVFLEAMVLGKTILSTKVSDYKNLDGKYGLFCEKTEEAVYNMMKDYLNNGFKLKETFDYEDYNKKIVFKIEKELI